VVVLVRKNDRCAEFQKLWSTLPPLEPRDGVVMERRHEYVLSDFELMPSEASARRV
jgi:hypothetical protein